MLVHPLKKKRIGDKSKKLLKPTSLGREQNKSRTKLKEVKVDENQFKRFTNKALLSVSMEMEDKNELKLKRSCICACEWEREKGQNCRNEK